jgi:hypothetical protein
VSSGSIRSGSPRAPLRWLFDRVVGLEDRFFAFLNARVDRRISLTVGAIVFVVGLGDVTARLRPRLGFYGTLAQVLPVLLLAVVVEGRYFRGLERRQSFDRFLLKGLLYVPLLGEAAALACVAEGHDTALMRGVVLFALGLTVILLIVYASDGPATGRSMETSAMLAAVEQVKTAAKRRDGDP